MIPHPSEAVKSLKDSSVVERKSSKASRKSSGVRAPSEPEWKKTASKIPDIPIFEDQRLPNVSEYVPAMADQSEQPIEENTVQEDQELEMPAQDVGSDEQDPEEEEV